MRKDTNRVRRKNILVRRRGSPPVIMSPAMESYVSSALGRPADLTAANRGFPQLRRGLNVGQLAAACACAAPSSSLREPAAASRTLSIGWRE